MCGRYSQKYDGRKLVVRYHIANRDFEWSPNRNISPSQSSPVVLIQGGRPHLKIMRWGLIPPWAKDAKIGSKCFNARAETVAEKPTFRGSFNSRRCLVPADAFYEWQAREGRKKLPYRISMRGEEIFSLAGLWSRWEPPDGDPIETYTILTTEPNELLKPIHDRMPVILAREAEMAWADPSNLDPDFLRFLMRPFPAGRMEAEPDVDPIDLIEPSPRRREK